MTMKAPCILIVDDEWLFGWALEKRLERAGYRVLRAGTGGEASDLLEQDIQLVLLDVELPDANGLDLIAGIKERRPDCQVVLMTAAVKPGAGEKAVRRGAHELVEKPFDLRGMVELVDDILHWRTAV